MPAQQSIRRLPRRILSCLAKTCEHLLRSFRRIASFRYDTQAKRNQAASFQVNHPDLFIRTLPMQRITFIAGTCVIILACASAGKDAKIRIPSTLETVAQADAIVIGKVESIEDKLVKARSILGGDADMDYHVAVVKIADGISGVKGLTHVKVAFVASSNQPGGPGRYGFPKLEKDQEACLLLSKHPTEAFYVASRPQQIIDKKNDKDVEQVKKLAKILADADKNLKSKDKDERFLAAALLIIKYRPIFSPLGEKTESIDAGQSKAILEALADTDLNKEYPELQGWNAMTVFYRLGVTEKDGWKLPRNATPDQVTEATRKWLKDNAGKYRIQRLVPEDKKENKDK
jgi:hypothetical protein